MTKKTKKGALSIRIPARSVERWEELKALCAQEAGFQPPDSAVIELAIRMAVDNLAHIPGFGLVLMPERHGQFSLHRPGGGFMHRPDGGVEVLAGGHLGRRLEPGETDAVEGVPIRPVPKGGER